jgi:hypothetical protein
MREVFQDLAAHDGIEGFIGVRDQVGLNITQMKPDTFAINLRMRGRLIHHIEGMTFVSEFSQEGQEQPVSGADIEDPVRTLQRQRDVAKPVDAALKDIFQFRITAPE